MLAGLRSAVRNPIVLVIIIAPLVVGFAIFGVSDVFIRAGDAVAVVGPEKVAQRELARAFDQRLRREQQENPTLTSEAARNQGLGDIVLDELIVGAQIRAQARELNLAVSPRQVADEIIGFEAFVDPVSGGFDQGAYAGYLANERITANQFEEDIRQGMLRQQFVEAMFAGIRTPESYGNVLLGFQNERRSMRAIVIPPEAAGDVDEPTDEQLQNVIDENFQGRFTIPERRAFTLVRFRVADFVMDVGVDEAEIREQYDYEVDTGQIGEPATRSYTQIRFENGEDAQAAADRLNAGEDPDTIAADLGADAPFSLEDRQSYQVPDETLADAIFATAEGESIAVEARLGWFAVRIDAAQDATIPEFETRQAEIRELMGEAAAADAMYDAMGEFESAITGGATLEEAAEAAGVPYEVFGPIDAQTVLNSRDAFGRYTFTFVEQTEIFETMFEQIAGVAIDLQLYGEGDYFALRVDEIEPSSTRSLDEAREDAGVVYRLQSVDARLEELAHDAMERAEAGETLEAIAASIPGASVETAALNRAETAAPFGREAVGTAFFMEPGDVEESRSADNRSRLVLVLDEITQDASDGPEDVFELRSVLAQQMQGDIDRSLVAALGAKYPRDVDNRLRDQALGVIDPTLLQ
jgi:peptidyl-prolyl cis-trans isomerase D